MLRIFGGISYDFYVVITVLEFIRIMSGFLVKVS
jgi:hypothetical protein